MHAYSDTLRVKLSFTVRVFIYTGETELSSTDTDGYWGDWGPWQRCPSDHFVFGFIIKSEAFQGKS